MDEKVESLQPCSCGDSHLIISKIKPGLYCVACGSCPRRALGSTEAEARKNWNREAMW